MVEVRQLAVQEHVYSGKVLSPDALVVEMKRETL